MARPRVSVVVPTYNRPDTLRTAIESVMRQSFDDWELCVVGDQCDERTSKVAHAFDDRRVRYTNLPIRFGEQSGPNSIGVALAAGEYLAFLNHDDVWLQDHLARSVEALAAGEADFQVGRSLFAREVASRAKWKAVPVFSEINPPRRFAVDAFTGHPILFEPASAWLVRTAVARKVGHWRPAANMHRTPAQEWVLRAWKTGARFAFADIVTVLKVATHYRHDTEEGNYAAWSPEHEYLGALLRSKTPGEIRDLLRGDLEEAVDHRSMIAPQPKTRGQRLLHRLLINRPTARAYRLTGIDGFELYGRLTRRSRGEVLRYAIRQRTGDELPEPPDINGVLTRIRAEGSAG